MEYDPFSVGSVKQLFQVRLMDLYLREEISRLADILFLEWKGWSRAETALRGSEALDPPDYDRFMDALGLLQRHYPIQYIIGKVHFNGHDFLVGPGVLIPRPETEELVELIIRENRNKMKEHPAILDIGTGSGCIAISLKKIFTDTEIYAMDQADSALALAEKNAHLNNCMINLLKYDILSREGLMESLTFSMIISNPPYVTESERKLMQRNVVDHEPQEALFVPDDDPLLFYRAISGFALDHLQRQGLLYFEINERFGKEVVALLESLQFRNVTLFRDFRGKDRFVRATLTA